MKKSTTISVFNNPISKPTLVLAFRLMNYLAHLHIADHCQSSLLGNLLGDFVKGDPSAQFSPEIARGIRLHRLVDAYTDSHPVMQQAQSLLFLANPPFCADCAGYVLGSLPGKRVAPVP